MVATTVEWIASTMIWSLVAARGAARPWRGAAALELALVLPVLLSLVLGMFEFSRALLVSQLLTSAAREGARTGSVARGDNDQITTAVTDYLTTAQVTTSGMSLTVLVNGNALDAAQAQRGDSVTVSVSLPYKAVTWLPAPSFLGGKTLVGAAVMRRE